MAVNAFCTNSGPDAVQSICPSMPQSARYWRSRSSGASRRKRLISYRCTRLPPPWCESTGHPVAAVSPRIIHREMPSVGMLDGRRTMAALPLVQTEQHDRRHGSRITPCRGHHSCSIGGWIVVDPTQPDERRNDLTGDHGAADRAVFVNVEACDDFLGVTRQSHMSAPSLQLMNLLL